MIDSIGVDHNPIAGIYAIPCTGVGNCNTSRMSLRSTLANNLKALMGNRPDLDTLPKITAATGGRLSNGKLDRIRRAAAATDVDTLDDLAGVFGVHPWQLLQRAESGEEPASEAKVIGLAARRWPFDQIDPGKIGALGTEEASVLQVAWLRVAKNLEIDVETGRKGKKRSG